MTTSETDRPVYTGDRLTKKDFLKIIKTLIRSENRRRNNVKIRIDFDWAKDTDDNFDIDFQINNETSNLEITIAKKRPA